MDERAYSPASEEYLKVRDIGERKALGQYLTPRSVRERLLDSVPLADGDRVLDPGVGTGEFLLSAERRASGLYLEGWDIDPQALSVAREVVPDATLIQQDGLLNRPDTPFDVVIGNPPYFEIRGIDSSTKRKYASVISGRPNIFALFFAVALESVRDGGHVAYVVPPSMNNGAYFSRLREYIREHASVEHLEVLDGSRVFADAQTSVQLIVLKKGGKSTRFTADLGALSGSPRHRVILTDNAAHFEGLYEGRSSLWALGYEAVTGTVVWNNHRERLRREASASTVPLMWASNIGAEPDVLINDDHPKRPQYIEGVTPIEGPAIIVNRIVGSVGAGSLRCALVPEGMKFVGENHVNVIRSRPGVTPRVSISDVLAALRSPLMSERVRNLTGNTQLSATELTHWLPLDIERPGGMSEPAAEGDVQTLF